MAKRRRKKVSLPARLGEQATMERRRQLGGVVAEVIDRDLRGNPFMKRDRARCECVLDDYLYRLLLTLSEHEAGMKFRCAYLRGVCRVMVDDPGTGGEYDPEMAMLIVPISEEILREAYKVLTKAQKEIMIRVCGHGEWAGGTDKLETLRRALERLVTLWKL